MPSEDLNLYTIRIQDPVDSTPLRSNFSDVQTQFNALRDEVSNLSASTSTSEVVSARDNFTTLQERLQRTQAVLGRGVIPTYRTINDCEATTLWTASANAAVSVDNTTYVEGLGSIAMAKTGSAASVDYSCDITNQSFQHKYIRFQMYVKDATMLGKIDDGTSVYLDITPDENFTTNYKTWEVSSGLGVGWNEISVECDDPDSTTGTVADSDSISHIRLRIVTDSSSDTFSAGDLLVDDIVYYSSELKVVAASTPDMTITVLEGDAIVNGNGISRTSSSTSGSLSAPSANPRYDLVTVDKNNVIHVYTGKEAASPIPPDVPHDHVGLARIYHRVGETSIKQTDDSTNGFIQDYRTFITNASDDLTTYQVLGGSIPNTIAYVSPTGEVPFTTIQSAVNYVNALGGGMVVVGAGTYDENIVLTGMSNITIRGCYNLQAVRVLLLSIAAVTKKAT